LDVLIILEFNKEFSNMSYIDFFKNLKSNFSFTNLIVGEDIKIGKNKLGNKNNIKKLGKILNFKTEFVKKMTFDGKIISSSYIRDLIREEKFDLVEKLLDRKYK